MPNWIIGTDGEKSWDKAAGIVRKEYGSDIEKSDSDKFYSLVTTVYKNICKSPDYDCGIGRNESVGDPKLASLAEELAVFCEAISISKLREADQIMGFHRQDANYLRRYAKKESGDTAKDTLEAAKMHDIAADAFAVVLKSKTAKDLKKAKAARMDALRFTRDRAS